MEGCHPPGLGFAEPAWPGLRRPYAECREWLLAEEDIKPRHHRASSNRQTSHTPHSPPGHRQTHGVNCYCKTLPIERPSQRWRRDCGMPSRASRSIEKMENYSIIQSEYARIGCVYRGICAAGATADGTNPRKMCLHRHGAATHRAPRRSLVCKIDDDSGKPEAADGTSEQTRRLKRPGPDLFHQHAWQPQR